jgi:hypothetical protein
MDPTRRLLHLIDGYQPSQALHVAASLRISDILAVEPRCIKDLATETKTNEPALFRLMRALESIGVYTRDDRQRYANTELGERLRSDVPGSLAGWAEYVGRSYYRQAWGGLLDSVRIGDNAFARIHGMSPWQYRRGHPEEQIIFDAAMTSTAEVVLDAVVASYDFGRFGCVADIGGGVGTLLLAVLRRYRDVRGVLFDQSHVTDRALAALHAAGVAQRSEAIAGDFFVSVPTGADAYLLKSIIHDWGDEDAVTILRVCRQAMSPDATLLLIEQLIGQGPDPSHTAFSDLNMLVSPGGQERTLEEYAALLAASGFQLTGAAETGTPAFVIEATPVA